MTQVWIFTPSSNPSLLLFIPPIHVWPPLSPLTSHPLTSCSPSPTFCFFISSLHPSFSSSPPPLLNSPRLDKSEVDVFHFPLKSQSTILFFLYSSISLPSVALHNSVLLHSVMICLPLPPPLLKERPSSLYSSHTSLSPLFILLSLLSSIFSTKTHRVSVEASQFLRFFWWVGGWGGESHFLGPPPHGHIR